MSQEYLGLGRLGPHGQPPVVVQRCWMAVTRPPTPGSSPVLCTLWELMGQGGVT